MVKTHRLKTKEPFFSHVRNGFKTAEVRLNDRDYKLGDYLILERCDQSHHMRYEVVCQITNIVTSEECPEALMPGYCLLSFRTAEPREAMVIFQVEHHDCCSPCNDPACKWLHHAPIKEEA